MPKGFSQENVSGAQAASYRNKQAVRCSARKLIPRDSDVIYRYKESSLVQQHFNYGNQIGVLDTAFFKQFPIA